MGQTSRHFKTRIKEHLPAYELKFIEKELEIKTMKTKNAAKRSSVAEHLINNRDCTRKYDMSKFKIIHHCKSVFDLAKLEAISTFKKKQNCANKKNLITKCFTNLNNPFCFC